MTLIHNEIIPKVQHEFDELLGFVLYDSRHTSVYEVECGIWQRLLKLGWVLLKSWFQLRCQEYGRDPRVDDTGVETPFLENKERTFFSVFGKFKIPRPYFYRRGGCGASPLDELLGLGDDIYSDMLRQMDALLAVYTTYGTSGDILKRFLSFRLSTRAKQQIVRKDAQDVVAYYDKQEAPPVGSEAEILVAQADGKGVPLILTGFDGQQKIEKKEALVTSVYTIASQPRTPDEVLKSYFDEEPSKQQHERDRPHNKKVWATLAGKETAFTRLQKQVTKREGSHIAYRVALCDGDPSLQRHFQERLSHFTLILDFIHANSYLWDAAKSLFPDDGHQCRQWVKQHTAMLLSSQTTPLITTLRTQANMPEIPAPQVEELTKAANYFARNQAYMDYKRYLAQGLPIASGVIEGACRHLVKDRMEGSGMHWQKPTAEAMLALRAVAENDDWEDYHAFRRQRRQKRLYYPDSPEAFVPTVYHQLPLAF